MAGGVLSVRSSSSLWSSLRSISSRRRRIRERLLSEVMTSQHRRRRPQPGGWGACQAGAAVSRADRTRPLHSAAVGEVCWFFASSTSPSGRYRLVALPTPGDLFIRAKDLFAFATTRACCRNLSLNASSLQKPLPLWLGCTRWAARSILFESRLGQSVSCYGRKHWLDSSSDPLRASVCFCFWHSGSLRCVVKFRKRSERSGRGESVDRCPAILTIHFARRRDIGAIRTIPKKRSLAVACRT